MELAQDNKKPFLRCFFRIFKNIFFIKVLKFNFKPHKKEITLSVKNAKGVFSEPPRHADSKNGHVFDVSPITKKFNIFYSKKGTPPEFDKKTCKIKLKVNIILKIFSSVKFCCIFIHFRDICIQKNIFFCKS